MTAAILDGERIAAVMPTPATDPRAYLLAFYPEAPIPPIDHVALTADPLPARINHGTWIVSCDCGSPPLDGAPAPGCVVWTSIPLAFCVRCLNRPRGGGWRPVTLPSADERAMIEAVLVCRAELGDRNWHPGETVGDLVRQNIEHGDAVPEGV